MLTRNGAGDSALSDVVQAPPVAETMTVPGVPTAFHATGSCLVAELSWSPPDYTVRAINVIGPSPHAADQGAVPSSGRPSAPDMTANPEPGVSFSWTISNEGGASVTTYGVVRDGVRLGTVAPPSPNTINDQSPLTRTRLHGQGGQRDRHVDVVEPDHGGHAVGGPRGDGRHRCSSELSRGPSSRSGAAPAA